MFYRLTSLALVALGLFRVLDNLIYNIHFDKDVLWSISGGMNMILIGILNYVYLYETPKTNLPRLILLGTNGLFIGFLILMISASMSLFSSYAALGLLLITSILVLNRRV